jgi:hypothetical protein
MKIAALQLIAKRQDFPKLQRLDFLFDVVDHDADLRVVNAAGRAIDDIVGLPLMIIPTWAIDRWWAVHRKDYAATDAPPTTRQGN